MCHKKFTVYSEPRESNYMDINSSVVAGVKSAVTNYTELEEITFAGIKCMSKKTYEEISVMLDDAYTEIAKSEMKKAGDEERVIAEQLNCKVDKHYTCPIMLQKL